MLLNDTFTAPNGTALTAHTSDSGDSWVIHPVSAGTMQIDGGRAHANAFSCAYSSISAADCEVGGVFHCLSPDGNYLGLLARMNTTSVSWYGLFLQLDAGLVIFSGASLASYSVSFSPGVDYRVKLSLKGSRLRAFLDGYEAIRLTHTGVPGPGRVGLCFGAGSDTTHGIHLDSLTASDAFSASQLLFVGDSLTIGGGPSSLAHADRYPTRVMALLESNADWGNRGVSGRTLAEMLDDADEVDECRRPNAEQDVVIFWGGLNDLSEGASAADVIDRLTQYGDDRRAAGFKIVALTMIAADPGSSSIPDDIETSRTAINSWLRANWSLHFDALADVAADSRLATFSNATYFQVDGVHLKAAGAAVVAEIVAAAIGTLDDPAVHVTAPASGAILLTGHGVNIEWNTNGPITAVNVLLSIDGGENYDITLASGIANTGAYVWSPTSSQLADDARIRVVDAGSDATGDSPSFQIATTSLSEGGGVVGLSLEEFNTAINSLIEHGDTVWGRNPVLPVVARVNAEPVTKSSLIAYQRGRATHSLFVIDATGEPVNLSAKTLRFSLETLTGATIGSTDDILILGEDANIASLTTPETWHEKPGLYRYAMRDIADGARVWARGDYVVEPTAGPV